MPKRLHATNLAYFVAARKPRGPLDPKLESSVPGDPRGAEYKHFVFGCEAPRPTSFPLTLVLHCSAPPSARV